MLPIWVVLLVSSPAFANSYQHLSWWLVLLLSATVVLLALGLWRIGQQRRRLLRLMGLSHSADAITGLSGRAILDDRLSQAIGRHQRQQQHLAVLSIRLLPLSLRESHRHDANAAELAGAWRRSLRRSDTVARWHSNEFVVLLEQLQQPDAAFAVANNLIAIAETYGFGNGKQRVHIGIALFPNHGVEGVELLRQAQASSRQAELRGCNGYAIA